MQALRPGFPADHGQLQHDERVRCGQAMTCHKAQGMTLDYLNVSLQVPRSARGCLDVQMALFCGSPNLSFTHDVLVGVSSRIAPIVLH